VNRDVPKKFLCNSSWLANNFILTTSRLLILIEIVHFEGKADRSPVAPLLIVVQRYSHSLNLPHENFIVY
jgi:hypothetical protein